MHPSRQAMHDEVDRLESALLHGRGDRRQFMKAASAAGYSAAAAAGMAGFAERAHAQQLSLIHI